MKLFAKIVLIIFFSVLIITGIFGLINYQLSQKILENPIITNQALINQEIMNEISNYLYERYVDIQLFAGEQNLMTAFNNDNNTNFDILTVNQRLQEIIATKQSWNAVNIVNYNGQIIATSQIDTEPILSPAEQTAYDNSLGGQIYYSDLILLNGQDKPTIIFSAPIRNDESSEIQGIIIGQINWQDVSKKLNNINKEFNIRLLNSENIIIASNQPNDKILEKKEKYSLLISNSLTNNEDHFTTPGNQESGRELISLSPFKQQNDFTGYKWTMVLGSPISIIFSAARKMAVIFALIFIFITVFILDIILILIFRFVIKPVDDLTLTVKHLSAGDFSKRATSKAHDEIGELAKAFNSMADNLQDLYSSLENKVKARTAQLAQKVTKIKEQNQMLEEAKQITSRVLEDVDKEKQKAQAAHEKTEVIIENIYDGVLIINNQEKIVSLNKIGRKLLGCHDKEIIGEDYNTVFNPLTEKGESLSGKKSLTSSVLRTGHMMKEKIVIISREDNNQFTAKISVSPLIMNKEIFGAAVIFRDVTREMAIDKQKTEFISVASHQLRTPLSSIKWFIEMLLHGDAGKLKNEQSDLLNEAYESNERMIKLVNDLLNVSRIEQGRVSVEPHPTDFQKMVKSVLRELTPSIKAKQIKVNLKTISHLKNLYIDAELIRQVVQNLLTNAIKYTPPQGQVNIDICLKGNNVQFSVQDTGFGIPEDQKSNIFKKFFRASNAVSKETEGNGLGLYLAKSVVESSGGKMWFDSVEHKGSTFYFTLPLIGSKAKKGEVGLVLN
ncbi:MAG: ATP-binding protein [Patescibacteria group bacterium]